METKIFRLKNINGVEVEFLSYGGKIKSVKLPYGADKVDVVLGYKTEQEYLRGDLYIGALCGRFANRIGNGTFQLEGKIIKLSQNEHPNHIHGGVNGFNIKPWYVKPLVFKGYASAYKLSLLSPDGDENYPGNLHVEVVYALNDRNELLMDLKAVTDKTTIINLTNHSYFNLNGAGNGNVLNHMLQINGDHFTPIDEYSIPIGKIASVSGTDLDFRLPVKLSDVIHSDNPQIKMKGGIDHNWAINRKNKGLSKACVLSVPELGRAVEVFTSQPGLQVYTAMHFDGTQKEKCGEPLTAFSGVALEAQNFPDAPNKPNFPNAILYPGATYHEQIVYRFVF